ncbi:MAG TPA: STAS domain-containing protein [Solirubrobacteraceae bacterium]|nr:STAS domain-containing protein [Solirubrobacteraceae bacterium]
MHALQLSRFDLEVRPERARAVLVVSGELDLATAPAVAQAIDELWELGWTELAIDLAAVSFIDSTGLGTLLALFARAESDGRRLTVGTTCPSLERLLTVSGLAHAVPRS